MGFNDAVRQIKAQAVIGSTTYTSEDEIKEFTLDRNAEGKFFGFSVAAKLNLKLRNAANNITIPTGTKITLSLKEGSGVWFIVGVYYTTEIHTNENNTELSITAYDSIYFFAEHTFSEVGEGVTSITGLGYKIKDYEPLHIVSYIWRFGSNSIEDKKYPFTQSITMNFEGTEDLRTILNQMCEATQTFAFMDGENLVFARLDNDSIQTNIINKSDYYKFVFKENRRLVGIVSTTELGDNIGEQDSQAGTVQYINENGFLNMNADAATFIEKAYTLLNGLTIGQFDLEWRGNPAYSYGSKLKIQDSQGKYVVSYLLDDSMKYDGTLTQKTKWAYTDAQTNEYNDASLGSALAKTYAKVDKVEGRIDLVVGNIEQVEEDLNGVVSDISDLDQKQASLTVTVNGINTQVTGLSSDVNALDKKQASLEITMNGIKSNVTAISSDTKAVEEALEAYKAENEDTVEGLNSNIAAVQNTMSSIQTAQAQIFQQTQTLLDNQGKASSVSTTTTTIDNNGVTVGKSSSSLTTTLSNDGIQVKTGSTVELTANSQGVIAHNLTADNYLIVDGLIRWQKYVKNNNTRMACFWIGG